MVNISFCSIFQLLSHWRNHYGWLDTPSLDRNVSLINCTYMGIPDFSSIWTD